MFESFIPFLLSIGINPTHLFAGLAGSLVRAFVQGKRNVWEILTGSMVGSFCAMYLTPLIGRWLSLDMSDLSTNNGVAFVIGILGLSLAEGLFRWAQRWAANPKLPTSTDIKSLAEAFAPPRSDTDEDKKP